MQRERNFKIYLSNPSMRAALFSAAKETDTQLIGHLAESAVFSQWQHSLSFSSLRYARWRNGEVDVVFIGPLEQKAQWAGEIKWSDRIGTKPNLELKHLRYLLSKHPKMADCFFTTKTVSMDDIDVEGRSVSITPTALYCYTVGANAATFAGRLRHIEIGDNDDDEPQFDL